ncbi:hypothetical protein R1sor_000688 [Riccia sorocarpa]|uniref:F-box domain-containing protein n=1 Tax=Riccia sorocarpa TaxID=122646 RepID=A0ABD3GVR9_9MARC
MRTGAGSCGRQESTEKVEEGSIPVSWGLVSLQNFLTVVNLAAQRMAVVPELGNNQRQEKQDEVMDEIMEEELESTTEALASSLPIAVVEKILCKIPFPEVLKARMLNQEWNSQFSSFISAHQGSTNWPTYCPVFLSYGELLGFNRTTNSWRKVKLKALEQEGTKGTYVENFAIRYNTQALEGSLLCTLEHRKAGMEAVITIVNLLSGKRRRVECPGIIGEPWNPAAQPPILKLLDDGSFRILIRDHDRWWGERRLQTQVYSSDSDSWNCTLHRGKALRRINLDSLGNRVFPAGHAYLDGTLYWLEGVADAEQNIGLVRVFVEEECHLPWRLTSSDENHDQWLRAIDPLIEFQPADKMCLRCINVSALRSGQRTVLTLVLHYQYGPGGEWSAQMKLYQVERKVSSFQVMEISALPGFLAPGLFKEKFVAQVDDDSVYVCGERLTSYHLGLRSWTDHGVLPGAAFWERNCLKQCLKFDPRLNPFVVP